LYLSSLSWLGCNSIISYNKYNRVHTSPCMHSASTSPDDPEVVHIHANTQPHACVHVGFQDQYFGRGAAWNRLYVHTPLTRSVWIGDICLFLTDQRRYMCPFGFSTGLCSVRSQGLLSYHRVRWYSSTYFFIIQVCLNMRDLEMALYVA